MTTWITICDTCKRDGWETGDMAQTDGERISDMIETAATGLSEVKTRRVSCLMGCKKACNITIQAQGKLNYTLGEFEPTTDAASGIVAYAIAHAQSETGRVPYRDWPEAIKGHFVTRHPPLPTDE
jgi:predicted metal-binding protein